MQIIISELDSSTKKVTLTGKLDIAGAQAIETPLAAVAGARGNVVIDMAGVDFISSIGIRHLVIAAKAIARGAGKLVLLAPTPMVTEVLVSTGLEEIFRSSPRRTTREPCSPGQAVPDTSPSAPNDIPVTETRVCEIDRGEVAKVDEWIEAVGRKWGESERTTFAARICVAELFANVIEHGNAKSDRDHITVTLTRRHDGIGIEFLDTCAPFDPTAVAAPVLGNSISPRPLAGEV